MDGVEIVITPRTIERVLFVTVIVVLLGLLIYKWNGSGPSAAEDQVTANSIAKSPAPAPEEATPGPSETLDNPCENGVKDGGETDADCGGTCSKGCAEYKACNLDKDCLEGLYCFQHIKCMKPTCEDGIKNQDETNVDCGGTCGGYFWKADKACHDKEEPSGTLETSFTADIGRSPNSGNAVINNINLKMENGLDRDLSMSLTFFARTPSGDIIFENQDGEIAFYTGTLSLKSGDRIEKLLDLKDATRKTLPGVKSTEAFQIVLVIKDSVRKSVIDEITWTNS